MRLMDFVDQHGEEWHEIAEMMGNLKFPRRLVATYRET
jgi:hypothetical protein